MASFSTDAAIAQSVTLHKSTHYDDMEKPYMVTWVAEDNCVVYIHRNSLEQLERLADRLSILCRAERDKDTGDMGEDTVSLAPTQQAKQLSMAEQAALGVACGTSRAS